MNTGRPYVRLQRNTPLRIQFHFIFLKKTFTYFCSLYTVCLFKSEGPATFYYFSEMQCLFFVFLEHEMMKMV
jgi:hypothetical protein